MSREVTAGMWDSLKKFFGNILGWLKDLTSTVEQGADEMEQISSEAITDADIEGMF